MAERLRRVTDSLVRDRIYLWPGAAFITWAFPPWYGSTPTWNAVPSITLAGFGLYQLNRVYDVAEDEINDPAAYARISATSSGVRAGAIGALLASLVLSTLLMNALGTAVLSMMLLLGILYSVPFIGPGEGKPRRLKQVVVLKNAVPAVVWSVTTVLYPATANFGTSRLQLLLAIAGLACLIFAIEVAWDIRDMPGDRAAGIKTLATVLGAGRAPLISLGASSVLALVVGALVYARTLSSAWLVPAFLLILLPSLACLWTDSLASNRNRSHLLVLLNMLALLPMYLAGQWAG